jgi:hypothetical protein
MHELSQSWILSAIDRNPVIPAIRLARCASIFAPSKAGINARATPFDIDRASMPPPAPGREGTAANGLDRQERSAG